MPFPIRKPISRRIALSGLMLTSILAASSLTGCESIVQGPKVHEHRILEIPHIAGSALSVDNANGWIEARSTERHDVSISVELYGYDQERLHQAIVHADRLPDNTLSIWVQWPGDKREKGDGSSISIQLPDANGITAHSSNGRITIAGLSGHASLESSNGAIKVDTHDGSVFADTSNGALVAEHVSGEIEMYTSNGKIIITDAISPIRAETSNGKVYISTMDGNSGPIRVRSSNGRVDLDLGDGFVGVLKCETSNGSISLDDLNGAQLIESSKNRLELHLGGGGDEISAIRTSNGSINIKGRIED